jgi:hypothetical protein
MAEERASRVAADRTGVAAEARPASGDTDRVEPTPAESAGAASRLPTWLDEAIDALLVTILALASVAAAWSGYQAARWSGVQASNYAQASARRVDSTRAFTFANQQTTIDVLTFSNFVNAWLAGDAETAAFYQQRFRAEFVPAFDAWMATDPLNNPNAPPSPFAMPEYAPANLALAAELEAEAGERFAAGAEANQQADDYVLNTVVLATVLFFAGVAPRVRWLPAQLVLISLALLLFAYGLINVATYPIE